LRRNDSEGGETVGKGVITLTKNASVSMQGTLTDGRRFSTSSAIGEDGNVAFYVPFEHGTEVMIGWLRIPAPPGIAPEGSVSWAKPDPNGFSTELQMLPDTQ